MGLMDRDRKNMLELQSRLQDAMQKIQQQSEFITHQSSRLHAQSLQMEDLRQKALTEREWRQEREARLQEEIRKNQDLTRELEELRQKERRQENERRKQVFQRQSAMWTRPEGRNQEISGDLPGDQEQMERERARKKSEFELLVKQRQDDLSIEEKREQAQVKQPRMNEEKAEGRAASLAEGQNALSPEGRGTSLTESQSALSLEGRGTSLAESRSALSSENQGKSLAESQSASSAKGEENARRRQERIRASEESQESKKQLQQELMECSKNIRDMQRVIKELYQFKPCRQLCELLVNIRQKVFHSMEDIQEDLGYVAEAFGIREFMPNVTDGFDPKYHEQIYSNVPDARGKKIGRVYAAGFEMDGEVLVKAQVSIK